MLGRHGHDVVKRLGAKRVGHCFSAGRPGAGALDSPRQRAPASSAAPPLEPPAAVEVVREACGKMHGPTSPAEEAASPPWLGESDPAMHCCEGQAEAALAHPPFPPRLALAIVAVPVEQVPSDAGAREIVVPCAVATGLLVGPWTVELSEG